MRVLLVQPNSHVITLGLVLISLSNGHILWKRDRIFDNVIITNGQPYEQLDRVHATRTCAVICSQQSWCSSFFYIQSISRCLLNQHVFANSTFGVASPSAQYFVATNDAWKTDFYLGATRPGVLDSNRISWNSQTDPFSWIWGPLVALNGMEESIWDATEPNNINGKEGCMAVTLNGQNDGKAFDISCDYSLPFICEKP